jgi:hypothetical protein
VTWPNTAPKSPGRPYDCVFPLVWRSSCHDQQLSRSP